MMTPSPDRVNGTSLLDVRDLRNSAHIVMAEVRPAVLLVTLVACLSAGCADRRVQP